MENFKAEPFPCPNCGHEILIDMIKIMDSTYKVKVIDHTSNQQAIHSNDRTPGLYARDKAELVKENLSLRDELFIARLPWWRRLLL